MSIKLEKVVQTFYEGLEEGKLLGRKCPKCGNVEYMPAMHVGIMRRSGMKSAERPGCIPLYCLQPFFQTGIQAVRKICVR